MKRHFFLILANMILWSAMASAQWVRGYLQYQTSQGWMMDLGPSQPKSILIRPVYEPVVEQLRKMGRGDLIQGYGYLKQLDTQGPVLMLESIDFVGLRRLMGTWVSDKKNLRVEVLDFSRVQISTSSPQGGGTRDSHPMANREPQIYPYSIAPPADDGWMFFFHDEKQVNIGHLRIEGSRVWIEFYDPHHMQWELKRVFRPRSLPSATNP